MVDKAWAWVSVVMPLPPPPGDSASREKSGGERCEHGSGKTDLRRHTENSEMLS